MSRYIVVGAYNDQGAKGIVAGDSDRVAAMEALCSSVGAKLVSADITRGNFDFCVILEADTFAQVAAMTLKARASGAIAEVYTLESVNVEDIRSVGKGVQYTPPSG